MSATLINSTIILNEILALFRTKCLSLNAVDRQYDSRFGDKATLKPGTTIYARKPVQFTAVQSRTLTTVDTVEESVPITCATQIHIPFPVFTGEEVTMKVDDFKERYLKPAASRMAAEVDKLVLQHAAEAFWMTAGAGGTTPATATVLLQCGQYLDEMNVPEDDRYLFITPAANTALINALTGLYNPSKEIGTHYKTGKMVDAMGLTIGRSSNIYRLTQGSRDAAGAIDDAAGTYLVEGTTTLTMDSFGGASETITKGEKFTIAGVYAVTPETKINTGNLQKFTVSALATASSGDITVTFTPPIYTAASGGRQNVDALPADDAVVTPLGTAASTAYPHNICMHNKALALVTADLPIPKGTHEAKRDVLDGISMRFITDYNGITDEFFSRLDLYMGISTLRGESGVVLYG